MRKAFILALIISAIGSISAASKYPLDAIPDSLKKGANAVVRDYEGEFQQTDINNGTYKCTYTVTVFNSKGDDCSFFISFQDRFRSLKSFSAVVENAETGKVLKKYSKSDLTTSSYSSTFMTDDVYSLFAYEPSVYPYTITISYENRCQNGIPSYPPFMPVEGFNIALQKAKYKITVPSDIEVKYRLGRNVHRPKVETANNRKSYEWEINNMAPVLYEAFAPENREILPMVILSPSKFCMEGQCGELTEWKKLGSWVYTINKGRDQLPDSYKEHLRQMVQNAKSDREKVDILYKHMQKTTRYVGIQLGIGGFQTMPAETVYKTGFGDCKALSNYMKSMLAAIGIPSNYIIISTKYKDVYPDLPSFYQMNHAILAVPMAKDTIWLECTSQSLPFDYAHSSIAGHQVIWISENGGELRRVRNIPTDLFAQETKVHLKLEEEGNAKLQINSQHRYEYFDNMWHRLQSLSQEEQKNNIVKRHSFSKSKIEKLSSGSDEALFPAFGLNYTMSVENLASRSGNRLFVPLTIFNGTEKSFLGTTARIQDVVIDNEQSEQNTLTIEIPDGWDVEYMPKEVETKTKFGSFDYKVTRDKNTIIVTQTYRLYGSRYPAEEAANLRQFLETVDKSEKNRLVLVKQP